MMAAALLKELGADAFVSSLALDAKGQVVEAKGCTADSIKAEGGALAFDRMDASLPFPIPDDARAVLPLFPGILELSQYSLKVSGLTGDRYALKINGVPVSTLTSKDLEQGVNLTAFDQGPIAVQGKAILAGFQQNFGSFWSVGRWGRRSQSA